MGGAALKHAFPKNSPMSQDSEPGMTLLDWFAGMALSAMDIEPLHGVEWVESLTEYSYQMALGMMEARKDALEQLRQYSCEDEEQGVVGGGAGNPEAGEKETGKEEKAGEETREEAC